MAAGIVAGLPPAIAAAAVAAAGVVLPFSAGRLFYGACGLAALAVLLWRGRVRSGAVSLVPAVLPLGYALAVPAAASVGPAVEGVAYAAGLLGWWLLCRRPGMASLWPLLASSGTGALCALGAVLLGAPGRPGEALGYVNGWALLWAAGAVACLSDPRLLPVAGALSALCVASGSRGAALALFVGLGLAALVSPRRSLWASAAGVMLGGLAGGFLGGPGRAAVWAVPAGAAVAWVVPLVAGRFRVGGWFRPAAAAVLAVCALWCGLSLARPLRVPAGGLSFPLPPGVSRVEVEADGPVRVSVERALSLSTGREVAGAASSRGGRVELGLPRELDRFWTVVVRGEGAALRSVRACDAAGKVVWAARLGPLKVLPGSLASRLAEQDWSLWLRLRYARDCLELWRRRPMFGWGFGGWASSYPSVQRFMYFTSDAHSPFLQAGAEGGLLGFAGYLALWVLGIAGWLRGRRGEPAAPGAFGALACLLSYGAFDLALNLPEVVAGYLPLLAAGSGFLRDSGRRVPGRRPVLPLVCLLLCAYSVLSLAGQLELWRAQGLASAGRPLDARAHAVLAARLLPLDARAHAAAAAGEALVVPVDPSRAESAWRHWSLALALDRADPELRERAGWFLVRLGDPEGGLELLEEAVRLGPFRVAAYEGLAAGYAYSGFLLAERDPDRAREFLERAVGVRARYESVRARQPEWVPPEWRLPAGTSALWLAAGEAGVLLGRAEEVRDCLERVMEDRGLAGPAAVFLAVGFPREAEGWLSVARAYAPRADALFEEACRVAAFLDLAGEGVRR